MHEMGFANHDDGMGFEFINHILNRVLPHFRKDGGSRGEFGGSQDPVDGGAVFIELDGAQG